MRAVSSWGRLTADAHEVVALNDRARVSKVIGDGVPGIAYGMGRSYGDVCLNADGRLWLTTGMDRFICFDGDSGRLVCEAGVLLRDIQRLVLPHGWMLPVTPGTQLVTVGGAVACDIHGKNHHFRGCFGDHVRRIKLVRTDGQTIECGPQLHEDYFSATVGGLGLTGVIVEVEIQLRRVAGPWLNTETVPFSDLDEFFQLSDDSDTTWEHTVSWIDCISGTGGRGIFMRGNPSDLSQYQKPKSRTLAVPFTPPLSLINRLSLRVFNCAYYNLQKWKAGPSVTHYEPFFYPLDNISEWNRVYGPKGFYQYQSVVPREVGREAVQEMLGEIVRSGNGSFLAVLKVFGDKPPLGMMSFAQSGVTLALDFPNRGHSTHKLFGRLDSIVREAGGRLYMGKDARMPRDLFEAGYPLLNEFLKYRDPGISSELSRRLMNV